MASAAIAIMDRDKMDPTLEKIRAFRDERDWKQFHNPKDLAIAISIEAGELLEHFLWHSSENSHARAIERQEAISEEIADIAIYLLELSDELGIDIPTAIERKLSKNAVKYPVSKAKGRADKYTEL